MQDSDKTVEELIEEKIRVFNERYVHVVDLGASMKPETLRDFIKSALTEVSAASRRETALLCAKEFAQEVDWAEWGMSDEEGEKRFIEKWEELQKES